MSTSASARATARPMTPAPTTTHSTSSIGFPRSRDQYHREIGGDVWVNASERGDALGRQGRVLDVDRPIEKTQAVEHLPHFCDMATELDDRDGVAHGELGCDLVRVERRW